MKNIDISKLYKFRDNKDLIWKLIINWNISVSFAFLSDFSVSKVFRDVINNIWNIISLNTKTKARIVSIIDELANNAIEHWSRKWDINKLRINIKKKKKWLTLHIEVEDTWKWKDPRNALEMENLKIKTLSKWFEKHSSIRWRGLFMIIINIVDELYFRDSSDWWLIVWIKKNLKYEENIM